LPFDRFLAGKTYRRLRFARQADFITGILNRPARHSGGSKPFSSAAKSKIAFRGTQEQRRDDPLELRTQLAVEALLGTDYFAIRESQLSAMGFFPFRRARFSSLQVNFRAVLHYLRTLLS
jgi:hypothetical protein